MVMLPLVLAMCFCFVESLQWQLDMELRDLRHGTTIVYHLRLNLQNII